MKNLFLTSVLLLVFSCGKNGNKEVVKKEQPLQETSFRYVASNGNNANITFVEDSKQGNSIRLFSNNKTISIPQSKTDKNLYQSHDIEVKIWGDSLSISQGENIILLKKARGQ